MEGGLLAGDLLGLSIFVLAVGLLEPNSRRTCSGEIGRFLLLEVEGVRPDEDDVEKLGLEPRYVPEKKTKS